MSQAVAGASKAPPRVERVDPGTLQRQAAAIFAAAGAPDDEASLLAETLVHADARGMTSHGVVRLPIYTERLRAGGFRAGRKGRVLSETASTMLIDAEDGLGAVVSVRAMDEAIARARRTGVAAVAVRNSNHYGEAAYYALRAIAADMIGITTTTAAPIMPAHGSRTLLSAPLPLCIGVPAGARPPILLDMAMGVVSRGRVMYAAKNGQEIPLGWGMDRDGQPTTDPAAILNGGWLNHIGGYKGFGLTVMLDMLAGALSGGKMLGEMTNLLEQVGSPQGLGHFFLAVDVAAFVPVPAFKAWVDRYAEAHKRAERLPGVEEVILPGEPEFRRAADSRARGIVLGADVIEQVRAIARDLGVEVVL